VNKCNAPLSRERLVWRSSDGFHTTKGAGNMEFGGKRAAEVGRKLTLTEWNDRLR
jgi:hypothetical protein